MNEKFPEASVVVDAVCAGAVAVTTAPATGTPVPASTTRPRIVPVVPARAERGQAANSRAAIAHVRERRIVTQTSRSSQQLFDRSVRRP
jgi:hypothetical protein